MFQEIHLDLVTYRVNLQLALHTEILIQNGLAD